MPIIWNFRQLACLKINLQKNESWKSCKKLFRIRPSTKVWRAKSLSTFFEKIEQKSINNEKLNDTFKFYRIENVGKFFQ